HVFETAHLVENAVKDRGVAVLAAPLAKILVDAREHAGQRNIHRRGGEEHALQQRREQRGRDSLPRDVADEKSVAASTERDHVEAIASHGLARKSGACDSNIRQIRQRFRQELVLDSAGDFDFVVETRFGARRREQPRVLDDGGSFTSQRPQDFAVEIGERTRRRMAVEVQHAEQFSLARGNRGVERFDHRKLIDRNRHDRVQFEARDALLCSHSRVLTRVGDNQLAPRIRHTLDDALRNLQLIGPQRSLLGVARNNHQELAGGICQQQNAAFRTRELDGGVDNRGEDVFERETRAESAGDLQKDAQVIEFAGTGLRGGRSFHALDELLDRGAGTQVEQLVGIGHAEIDLVFGLQFVAKDLLAVYERAMAAAHVFERERSIFGCDLRLLAADAAVAKGQFVAGLAADAEWERSYLHFAARAVWLNHDETGGTWHVGCLRPRHVGNPSRAQTRLRDAAQAW